MLTNIWKTEDYPFQSHTPNTAVVKIFGEWNGRVFGAGEESVQRVHYSILSSQGL